MRKLPHQYGDITCLLNVSSDKGRSHLFFLSELYLRLVELLNRINSVRPNNGNSKQNNAVQLNQHLLKTVCLSNVEPIVYTYILTLMKVLLHDCYNRLHEFKPTLPN